MLSFVSAYFPVYMLTVSTSSEILYCVFGRSGANVCIVDGSRLDDSTLTSVHNESSLLAGNVTADSVQVHVR